MQRLSFIERLKQEQSVVPGGTHRRRLDAAVGHDAGGFGGRRRHGRGVQTIMKISQSESNNQLWGWKRSDDPIHTQQESILL